VGDEPGLVAIDSVDSFTHGASAEALRARIETVERLLDMLPPRVRGLLALRNTIDAAWRELAIERWRMRPGQRRVLRFHLAAMNADALTQVIEKPAARLGHVVDPGLTTLLISQAGNGHGAVAEIARALPFLWQGRRRGWLTAAALEAQGGIQGLFASAFDAFAASLSGPERDVVRAMVRSLSRLDTTMRWSASPAEWDALATMPAAAAVDPIALRDRLAASHFIDLWAVQAAEPGRQHDAQPALPADNQFVALVHEMPGLYGAEHATPFDAGFVLWRQQFASFVQGWTRAGHSAGALLPEQPLMEAELEAGKHAELLSEPERTLIAQSREQVKIASLKKTLRLRVAYVTGGTLLIGFVMLATAALFSIRRNANDAMAERDRAMLAEAAASRALAAATEQGRIAEQRLVQIKKIVESIGDTSLRTKLMAEYAQGVTPELSRPETERLVAVVNTSSNAGPTGPRVDQPKGFKLWRNGSTLRMRFIGGTSAQRALASAATQEWSRYANLKFVLVESGDAELRITFKADNGSWAYAGTDALGVAMSEPTMNLGIPELGAVLHEFGHVLGLIHEAQNPNAHLPWNREAVYREMTGPPNYWPREQVDLSILRPEKISGYRAFDPDSIMMSAFAGKLFTDGVARGGKQVLSPSDKEFAAKLYPR
jgi:hypothetical protein